MADNGNEQLIEYCVVTLPKDASSIDRASLQTELHKAFGEPVMLQGISSVKSAYIIFAELADKTEEIAYREEASREAFVVRSYLPDRYIRPQNVRILKIKPRKTRSTRDGSQPKHRDADRMATVANISLNSLWSDHAEHSANSFEKILERFLNGVRDQVGQSSRIEISGEIPLLPALYALDLCWSLANEIHYDEAKIK